MQTNFNYVMNKSSSEIARVLVLNTGGTISSVLDPNDPDAGLAPVKNLFKKLCEGDPSLNDEKFRLKLIKKKKLGKEFLVVPATHSFGVNDRRVAYNYQEYKNLIDSSNMNVKYWQTICKDISDNYDKYDGFVILHGTDTMAYTASALSFMLKNLRKSVILTGSQKPIFETRTDGRNNFVSSILLAGLEVVPEVTIFFFGRLLRGNRCIKRSSDDFFGFDSCNAPPILTFGVRMQKNYCNMLRARKGAFHAHLGMNDNVSTLRIFPGISSRAIQDALGEPYKGIVLHTYGAGNIPTDRKDLIDALKAAVDRGAIVVNCTQCPYGEVAGIYATGTILADIGVLSGNDMTLEAALAKLMFVLSMKRKTLESKKKLMETVMRGEMTVSVVERKRLLRRRRKCDDKACKEGSASESKTKLVTDKKIKSRAKRSDSTLEESSNSDLGSTLGSDAETKNETYGSDSNIDSDESVCGGEDSESSGIVNEEHESPTKQTEKLKSEADKNALSVKKRRNKKVPSEEVCIEEIRNSRR